jgi:dihydrolipoamide dehydrogenase
MKTYEVVVIGGGPGGYTAAIRAAQLGGSVCLVEKGELGGTCTNRGCIPTKALAASAHALRRVKESTTLGVRLPPGEVGFDFAAAARRRDEVVATLRDGIAKLLKANRVDRVAGTAQRITPGRVEVTGADAATIEIAGKAILVATGSQPATIPALPVDGRMVITSDELLTQRTLPRRLAIVGGGVIGCEFASILHAFGCEITVVELLERLLPGLEPALATLLQRAFKRAGIRVLTKTVIEGVHASPGGVTVQLPGGERLEVDQVLVSVGRRPATSGLGLEDCGVRLDHGRVQVDEQLFTGIEGLWAVGDAVGRTWLAHTAAKEGEVAAACALGRPERMAYTAIPAVVFTEPELALVGLNASEAKSRGLEVETGSFFYGASGKALCDGTTEGKVELVTERGSGKILGGFVVGEHAGTLIAEVSLAVDRGLTARQIAEAVHAHPTLPEMVMEAAADSFARAIHKAPARR